MRIALFTLDFPPTTGGVQQYLHEIAQQLASAHEITVVTPVPPPGESEPFQREVVPPSVVAFLRALYRLGPDRVLVGHAHPRLLLPAALYGHKPYSAMTYGNDFLAAQSCWHRPLFNWLLARARPLITISVANAQQLQKLGLPAPIVIHPGTDPLRFSPSPAPPLSPLTLLTVGRLVPRKGIDTVLEALPALLTEFTDLRYHITGDGPDRIRLEQMARDLGVADRVKFLGNVPNKELPQVYRNAHIFVMPVREEQAGASVEGFGIVYLEASASGLPVVAGRSGGAVEAVRDGETGYLVEPGNPTILAETLIGLLRAPEQRLGMGRAGRRWIEREMNWNRAAEHMMNALLTG